jgi:hypothetical protein
VVGIHMEQVVALVMVHRVDTELEVGSSDSGHQDFQLVSQNDRPFWFLLLIHSYGSYHLNLSHYCSYETAVPFSVVPPSVAVHPDDTTGPMPLAVVAEQSDSLCWVVADQVDGPEDVRIDVVTARQRKVGSEQVAVTDGCEVADVVVLDMATYSS